MIACGSSMYAALTALYYFKKLNAFTKINIYDPS
jgi:glucosamine 6-phosphate synthetase-like amidotransferase/phosphosugar isomerase protein